MKEFVDKQIPYLNKVRQVHKKRKLDRIQRNLLYINKKRANKRFVPGDLVLFQNVTLSAGRGTRATYKPAIILDICKSNNAALIQDLGTKRVIKYSFSHLKKVD